MNLLSVPEFLNPLRSNNKTKDGRRLPPELPPSLGWLPWLGHAIDFKLRPIDMLRKARRHMGEVFSFWLAGQRIHLLSSPKGHEVFFMSSDEILDMREVYQFMNPIFGKGICYDVPIPVFNEQVGFLRPALREERLRTYADIMVEETEKYLEGWAEQGEVDLLEATTEMTIFISGRCLFGPEFRKHLTTEFAQLYHDLEAAINIIAFYAPHLPLPVFQRRDRARQRMGELIGRVVDDRRQSGFVGEDFLQTLMDARYSDGRALTNEEITGLCLTILFAGHHTSAVLSAWLGVELLRNPHCLPPILAEQEAIFGSLSSAPAAAGGQRRRVTYEQLKGLPVLERAVKEAGRMHPPLVMLMRKINRDINFGGYVLPAGDLAMVSPDVSHRQAEIYPDPDRFDPDRFGPGREEDRKHLMNLILFGQGRHKCVGHIFAFQQVKALWSVILQNYELELVDHAAVPNYDGFVVGPRQPCHIRYRRRQTVRSAPRRSSEPALASQGASA
jgi:sterol 14-demethylase